MEKMVNLKGREDLAQTIERNNTGCVAAEIFLQYVSTSFPFPTLSTDFLYPELTTLDLCRPTKTCLSCVLFSLT